MKYLFYIIHPSKYHLFKHLIDSLIRDDHKVKVLISSKDVLGDLVSKSNWDYANIFPEGRRFKKYPMLISKLILLVLTIKRLKKYVSNEYDFFITDDLLGFWGKILNVKTIYFTDDHLKTIPYQALFFLFSDYILCPTNTNLGSFNKKKIEFNGYKQSAYLHPKYYKSNDNVLNKYGLIKYEYIIVRIVGLDAIHDIGKEGINTRILDLVQQICEKYLIVIIPEKKEIIPVNYQKNILRIDPVDIFDIMFYSKLLVADSQTMCAEAAFLGTPFIWYSHFFNNVPYLNSLINNYKLGYSVNLYDYPTFQNVLSLEISMPAKRDTKELIMNTLDLTEFMKALLTTPTQRKNI